MVPLSLREGLGGCLTISQDEGFILHHTWNISTGKFNSNYIASAALSLNTFREGHWVVLETHFFTIIVTRPPPKRWSIIPSGRVMLVVTTISSGRMSSLHILREDELENYTMFFFIPSGRVMLVVTIICGSYHKNSVIS